MQDFNKNMDELSKLDQELGLYNTENRRMIEPITVTYTEPKLQLTCTQEELEAKLFKVFTTFKANTFAGTDMKLAAMEVLSANSVRGLGNYTITSEISNE